MLCTVVLIVVGETFRYLFDQTKHIDLDRMQGEMCCEVEINETVKETFNSPAIDKFFEGLLDRSIWDDLGVDCEEREKNRLGALDFVDSLAYLEQTRFCPENHCARSM
jgi:hypothetical protein